MSNTSRRAVLAGAVTLPALAVPAIAGTPSETLKRAEQVIDLLRTRYVCHGWKIDEQAAERVLAYFRAGAPDDDSFGPVVDFFGRHGQSLDWVFLGDPGGMICKGAAHSKQAASLTPDPIFAAIEDHKRLWSLYLEAHDANGRLEESLPPSRRTWNLTWGDVRPPADCMDDPRWIESELRWGALFADADDAAWEMLRRDVLTSTGGVDALNAYATEFTDAGYEWPEGWERRLHDVSARLAEARS
jgi:hypothetical protein